VVGDPEYIVVALALDHDPQSRLRTRRSNEDPAAPVHGPTRLFERLAEGWFSLPLILVTNGDRSLLLRI
jgi:hypothetical protein